MQVIDFFSELGALVETLWNLHARSAESFSDVAFDALRKLPPRDYIDASGVIDWMLQVPTLGRQLDPEGRFGEPPVTVLNGNGFVIDLYFWVDSTTSIHDHAFSGAFHVLAGSSVHVTYSFADCRPRSPDVLVGKLQLNDIEVLRSGETVKITSGASFIHNIIHIDRPSLTLTIRTADHIRGRQLVYWPPGVAARSLDACDPSIRLRIRTLHMMQQCCDQTGPPAIAARLTDGSDLEFIHVFMRFYKTVLADPCELAALLGKLADQQRVDLVQRMLDVLKWERRATYITQLRSSVTCTEQRYLLALFLAHEDLGRLLDALKRSGHPLSPEMRIAHLFESLASNPQSATDFVWQSNSQEIITSHLRGNPSTCCQPLQRSDKGVLNSLLLVPYLE